MKAKEFWKIYDKKYQMYESASFSLKTEKLKGDRGYFETAIYQENGIWYIEKTIERSNDVARIAYDSEDEAFDDLMCQVKFYADRLQRE